MWSGDKRVSSNHHSFAGFGVNRLVTARVYYILLVSAISFYYLSIISLSVYKQVLLLIYLQSVMVNYHAFSCYMMWRTTPFSCFCFCFYFKMNPDYELDLHIHVAQITFHTKIFSSGIRLQTETKASGKWTIHASHSENEDLAC